MWPSMVLPILGICALHLTHPKCTHTAVNTHPVNTHLEQWAAIYAVAPGEQLGVRSLAQGTHLSRGIEGGESAVHSLPPPTIPAGPDSNPWPLGYDSDSLTIRPRLPLLLRSTTDFALIIITNDSWAPNQHIRMISEWSCDTVTWSYVGWKFSFALIGINYILKYIKIY